MGNFDWVIHVGDILGTLSVIVTLVLVWASERRRTEDRHVENQKRFVALETSVASLSDWMAEWVRTKMRGGR
jgi:hypothetical protein